MERLGRILKCNYHGINDEDLKILVFNMNNNKAFLEV